MGQATSTNPVLWRVDERGVAYVTLNRPQVYNAYNGDMIAALLAAFEKLSHEPLRVAVITGSGRNFQVGADINWLDAVRGSSPPGWPRRRFSGSTCFQSPRQPSCKAPVLVTYQHDRIISHRDNRRSRCFFDSRGA